MRFNPPPNWPAPPRGWEPGPQWTPDPSWPPPPPGWPLWVPAAQPPPSFAAPPPPAAQPPPSFAPPPQSAAAPPPFAARNNRRPTTVQDSIVPTQSSAPSRLAVIAIVCAVVLSPVGIVLGVAARRQVRRTHERGAGLAKAAIIVGSVVLTLCLIAAVVWAVLEWT